MVDIINSTCIVASNAQLVKSTDVEVVIKIVKFWLKLTTIEFFKKLITQCNIILKLRILLVINIIFPFQMKIILST